MSSENTNSRRQFLRNAVLGTISATLLPDVLKSGSGFSEDTAPNCTPTTLDYYGQGPFYTANAPHVTNGQLAGPSEPGTRLILSGQVKTLDCSAVVPGTVIEIWHANDAGAYDNSGFNLRGIVASNTQGFYSFETILPGKYLNGGTYRPRHIHFKITPPGFPAIITQLYFAGDTSIPGDTAASQTSGTYDASGRIIPITLNNDGKYEGTWDIAVMADGAVGASELHLDKGMIYSVSPNPFSGKLLIRYGVFNSSRIKIRVFDIHGTLVADLPENQLSPQKYEAVWQPPADLPAGVYFVALIINELQVHYLKVAKV